MKIRIIGAIEESDSGDWLMPRLCPGKRDDPPHVTIPRKDRNFIEDADREPVILSAQTGFVIYRRWVVQVSDAQFVPLEQVLLGVKHKVLSQERSFQKMRREIEAFENFEKLAKTPREPIAAEVRMFVWQRDTGKCVKCGCVERLEFDHVIPLAKGGSNTERNIQLLCEACNRSKGSQI